MKKTLLKSPVNKIISITGFLIPVSPLIFSLIYFPTLILIYILTSIRIFMSIPMGTAIHMVESTLP